MIIQTAIRHYLSKQSSQKIIYGELLVIASLHAHPSLPHFIVLFLCG